MLKYLIPYGLVEVLRRVRYRYEVDFEGIYSSFDEISALDPGEGFVDDGQIDYALDKARRQLENSRSEILSTDIARLSTLVNLLLKTVESPIEVYDVGGGAGHTYYNLYYHLSDPERVIWRVYELPRLVVAFEDFVKKTGLPNLSIHAGDELRMPGDGGCHICHVRATLHYIDRPIGFLEEVLGKVDYMFLSRLPASPGIATFATRQKLGRAYTPAWFFNLKEIIDTLEASGHEVIEVWNEPESFPMNNFPEARRLDHTRGILSRNGARAGKAGGRA